MNGGANKKYLVLVPDFETKSRISKKDKKLKYRPLDGRNIYFSSICLMFV
jgi:hypothetical protein